MQQNSFMNNMQQTSNSRVRFKFDLPMDIVFEILSRLPVRTLVKFKSVCKTWHAHIKNPDFIKIHHLKLNQIPNADSILSSVLVTGPIRETGLFKMWLQSRDKTHNPNPNPNFLFQHCPHIVFVCNGLVYATLRNDEAIICNPTTGEVCKVSQLYLPEIGTGSSVFLGFAFQDIEFKLLKVICSSSTGLTKTVVHAKLFVMRTNTWTKIKVKIEDTDTLSSTFYGEFCDSSPVVVKNVFYWKAYKSRTGMSYIGCVVSFDMSGYVFCMITFPEGIIGDSKHWQLVDLKGKLALVTTHENECIKMWVLNLKKRSWTMEFTVELNLPWFYRIVRVLGCEGNGNVVVQGISADHLEIKLFSYDRDKHKVNHLPFAVLKWDHRVYIYKESLLLI